MNRNLKPRCRIQRGPDLDDYFDEKWDCRPVQREPEFDLEKRIGLDTLSPGGVLERGLLPELDGYVGGIECEGGPYEEEDELF